MANFYPNGLQNTGTQYSAYNNPFQGRLMPPNPIGAKGFKVLRSKTGNIDFSVTETDLYHWLCNHTHESGQFDVRDLGDGRWQCNICGDIMNLNVRYDLKAMEAALGYYASAWNMVKLLNNGTISQEIMADIAKAFAVFEKFPRVVKFVQENIRNNSFSAQFNQSGFSNQSAQQAYAILNGSGFGYTPTYSTAPYQGNPFAGPQPYPQQPQYGPQPYPQQYGPAPYPQQPQYGPQPYPQPQYGPQPYPQQPQYGPQPYPQPQQPYGPAPGPMPQQPPQPPPQATSTLVPEVTPPTPKAGMTPNGGGDKPVTGKL